MQVKELEQTLVLIKPDALRLSLTGYILSQFSEFHTGLRFAGAKIVHVSRMLAEEHYAEHRGKALLSVPDRVHHRPDPLSRRAAATEGRGLRVLRLGCGEEDPRHCRPDQPPRGPGPRAGDDPHAGHGRPGQGRGRATSSASGWTTWSMPRPRSPRRSGRSSSGSGRATSCRTCGSIPPRSAMPTITTRTAAC